MVEENSKVEKGITVKKAENFSEWYTQSIIKSGFMDYSSVSGSMVFRPDIYFIWEMLQRSTDQMLKQIGVLNTYFPLLIPEHLLAKESKHVEGFSPEVAWVTEAGSSKFDERLAVRPTSEAIMYDSISKWVRSWRDLPMKLNQWNNVLRWEFKHPTPLIRSREFLWNEGHSAYATEDEALAERDKILSIYQKVLKEYLALAGIVGRKTDKEKFAGAVATFSTEFLMPDGWAIQGPDWHYDGQNFAKAFDIKFLNKAEEQEYAYQNTYAISTRVLGIMLAAHGDDKGLVIPPRLSRIQVVVVPIYNNKNKEQIIKKASEIANTIKEFRIYFDDREEYSPGWKFNEWEMKGIPIRIELGEKEMAKSTVIAYRRDTGEKTEVEASRLKNHIEMLIKDIHENLYERSVRFLKENTRTTESYEEFKKIMKEKQGIIHAPWCGESLCEDTIKTETGAKITNMPIDQKDLKGKCIFCGLTAKYMANFAKSY